jgi:hypothetical protein
LEKEFSVHKKMGAPHSLSRCSKEEKVPVSARNQTLVVQPVSCLEVNMYTFHKTKLEEYALKRNILNTNI